MKPTRRLAIGLTILAGLTLSAAALGQEKGRGGDQGAGERAEQRLGPVTDSKGSDERTEASVQGAPKADGKAKGEGAAQSANSSQSRRSQGNSQTSDSQSRGQVADDAGTRAEDAGTRTDGAQETATVDTGSTIPPLEGAGPPQATPAEPGWTGYLPLVLAGLVTLLLAIWHTRWLVSRTERTLSPRVRALEDQIKHLRVSPPTPPSSDTKTWLDQQDDPAPLADLRRPPPPAPAMREKRHDHREPPIRSSSAKETAAVDAYRRLLEQPALSGREFIQTLSTFGTVREVVEGAEGQPRLGGRATGGPGELLVAILFEDRSALLVPSLDFIKEFAITYKETLEAGPLMPLVFDLAVDGAGTLAYESAARAHVDADDYLANGRKGRLSGFVR